MEPLFEILFAPNHLEEEGVKINFRTACSQIHIRIADPCNVIYADPDPDFIVYDPQHSSTLSTLQKIKPTDKITYFKINF